MSTPVVHVAVMHGLLSRERRLMVSMSHIRTKISGRFAHGDLVSVVERREGTDNLGKLVRPDEGHSAQNTDAWAEFGG